VVKKANKLNGNILCLTELDVQWKEGYKSNSKLIISETQFIAVQN